MPSLREVCFLVINRSIGFMCWVKLDVVDCVHVVLYACGAGTCGVINNEDVIHVSGIEDYLDCSS